MIACVAKIRCGQGIGVVASSLAEAGGGNLVRVCQDHGKRGGAAGYLGGRIEDIACVAVIAYQIGAGVVDGVDVGGDSVG